MRVEHKLELFHKSAIRDAEERKKNLINEMQETMEQSCRDISEKTQNEANERIATERERVMQQKNKEVFESSTGARAKLLELRNRITSQLFDEVLARVEGFIDSDSYKPSLLEDVAKLLALYDDDIDIYICRRDLVYKTDLENLGAVNVIEGDDSIIGGFKAILKNQNIIIDYSYGERLREAKKSFSGFKLG